MQLLDDSLCQSGKVNGWVLVINVLGELSNGLCVGFGLKSETFALQQRLDLFVIGDDSVVDD